MPTIVKNVIFFQIEKRKNKKKKKDEKKTEDADDVSPAIAAAL